MINKVSVMVHFLKCLIVLLSIPSICGAKNLAEFAHPVPIQAPEIEFTDAKGDSHTLNSFRGKVVLLNFWATWCKPCLLEMPALSALQQSLEGTNVMVLPLSLDSKGAKMVEAFYKSQAIDNLPIYVDQKFVTNMAFNVRALPSSYIIGPQGRLVATITGVYEWDSPQVKKYLLSLSRE
jgi:thiol-disulfide isomerase/thioredoxin